MHPVLALHTFLKLHAPAILCLHSVGQGPDALPIPIFRELLNTLRDRDYQFLTADHLTTLRTLRRRTVLLTFDDGRADNLHTVLPILREYNIAATFYICSNLVGRRVTFPAGPDHDDPTGRFSIDLMTWDQLKQLRDAGMCIGSHGANHRELTRCTTEELAAEIAGSRFTLEEHLDIPIRHFSYPWGRFDSRVLSAVKNADYQTAAAVSVNPLLPLKPWNGFTLSRVTAHPAATPADLLHLIGYKNLVHRTASQLRKLGATL